MKRISIYEPYTVEKLNIGGIPALSIQMNKLFKKIYKENDGNFIELENNFIISNTEYFRNILDTVIENKRKRIPFCFNYKNELDLLYYIWINPVRNIDNNYITSEYELCTNIYFYNDGNNSKVYNSISRQLVEDKLKIVFEFDHSDNDNVKCNICDKNITNCLHIPGTLYDNKVCKATILKFDNIVRFELFHLNFE